MSMEKVNREQRPVHQSLFTIYFCQIALRLHRQIDGLPSTRYEQENRLTRSTLKRRLNRVRVTHGLTIDLQNNIAAGKARLCRRSVRVDGCYDHAFGAAFHSEL